MEHLRCLRTLSLGHPSIEDSYIPNISQLHYGCRMPYVNNINLLMKHWKEPIPLSNVVKLFEQSITVLSFTGAEYNTGTDDYIARVLFCNVHHMNLPNLRKVSVDFIEFQVRSLRKIVMNCPNIESLTVDCRGADGFMPFFYLIDLIRIACREQFDQTAMTMYDCSDDPMVDEDPLDRGIHMWKARVSRFVINFTTRQTFHGYEKLLDTAEIYLSTSDESYQNITSQLKFVEALQVFYETKFTFRGLQSLIFGTANEEVFDMEESVDKIKVSVYPSLRLNTPFSNRSEQEYTLVLCRECLPSAREVKIRWGSTVPFQCTLGHIHDIDGGEIWQFCDD